MIYIITACSRPENLEDMSKTIPSDFKWVIVYDDRVNIPDTYDAILLKCEDTGKVGVKAQNFALDNLPLTDDDHVMLLDDDNIIHPNWYNVVRQLLHHDFSIMTWGQTHKDGTRRLEPQRYPQVGNIDTASFLVSWKYNKNVRHVVDLYEHDGVYASTCSMNGPICCVGHDLCYYNYLR
jgi:hypothetical protein